jgi:Fe2+ or Zn2+ uptake regulation protein
MKVNWFTIFIVLFLISISIWIILIQIKEYHLQSDPKLDELQEILKPLFSKDKHYSGVLSSLNDRNILNEIKLYKGSRSYTINKEKVFICLKDENNEYYNVNLLIYVVLHEISHVICKSIGHTDEFHAIFEALLIKATEEGIYNPSIPIDPEYCTKTPE